MYRIFRFVGAPYDVDKGSLRDLAEVTSTSTSGRKDTAQVTSKAGEETASTQVTVTAKTGFSVLTVELLLAFGLGSALAYWIITADKPLTP